MRRSPSRPMARAALAAIATFVLVASCANATSSTTPVPPASPASPASPAATVAPSVPASATLPPTAAPAASASPGADASTGPAAAVSASPTASTTARAASGPDVLTSTVPRASADPAAAKIAAESVNAFALDLFRKVRADGTVGLADRNAVFSPLSIVLALALVRAGAVGETAAQIDAVLHASGWDALGAGLGSLDDVLSKRQAMIVGADGEPQISPALRIANAAFAQKGWSIEQAYLDRIATAFGAGLHLEDFAGDPEGARKAINAWISEGTAGRIPDLLAPGSIEPLTRIVLANAMYMKAQWEYWFDDQSPDAPFTRLDGSQVQVPTMHRLGPLDLAFPIPYASGNGWKAAELLYNAPDNGPQLAMTLVRPDDLDAFIGALTPAQLGRIVSALDAQRVAFAHPTDCPQATTIGPGCYPYDLDLYMPRFAISTRLDLPPLLSALGMPLAFDPSKADLTGIHSPSELSISTAAHQADIDVDEKGTEASAATAFGGLGGIGAPYPLRHITFRLDRPFIFLVRDLETGAVLFMGQVTDPSVGKGG